MDLIKLIQDSMTPDELFEIAKSQIEDTTGYEETLKVKLDQTLVKTAAMSSLMFAFMHCGADFYQVLDQFFRHFRKGLDEQSNSVFNKKTFKEIIEEDPMMSRAWPRLSEEQQKNIEQTWLDTRKAIAQDAVTEFISEVKTRIIQQYKEKHGD